MIASIRSRSLCESLEQTIGTKSDRALCARSFIEMSQGIFAEPTPAFSSGRRIMPRGLKRFMTDTEAPGMLHRDRQCARDALLRIPLAELRRAETLNHANSTFDANVCAVGLDSMPMPALGRIGRLSLARAYEQAPHRADAEKDADDGADPEPEHA
jgi:hypothetical protein